MKPVYTVLMKVNLQLVIIGENSVSIFAVLHKKSSIKGCYSLKDCQGLL